MSFALAHCCVDLDEKDAVGDGYSFRCPRCGKVVVNGLLKRWTIDSEIVNDIYEDEDEWEDLFPDFNE